MKLERWPVLLARRTGAGVLSAALFCCLAASAQPAQTLTLDPKRSELVVKTTVEGAASELAHDHVVRASDAEGTLSWNPAMPEATKVSVTVKVTSLVVDEPALRSRYGIAKQLSEKDRSKVTEAMLAEGQLDAARFPTITFVSTGAQRSADGILLSGRLTLHGVTRAITVPARLTDNAGVVTGAAELKLRTSDYGIKPYRAALGAIKNADEVVLVLRLVGVPKKAPSAP